MPVYQKRGCLTGLFNKVNSDYYLFTTIRIVDNSQNINTINAYELSVN